MLFVNWMSNGVYFGKISPERPHDSPSPFASLPTTFGQFVGFVQQAFWAGKRKVDPIPFGFAPYFLWAALVATTVAALMGRARRPPAARGVSVVVGVVTFLAAAFLVNMGYVPAWVKPDLKSQRAIYGDVFLAVTTAYWAWRATGLGLVSRRAVLAILGVCLALSDVYYVACVTRVDHRFNHPPIFDYDLSDGPTRHDLIAAIATMRREAEEERAGVVVAYPRMRSENTTDPGMFFARLLRHWGRYRHRRLLLFPCRWCDFKYGCPFPTVRGRPCAPRCCWSDPVPRLRHRFPGRRVFLWWHEDMAKIEHVPTLADLLRRLRKRWRITPVPTAPPIRGWTVLALEPRP
jgi:hypothetical protein